MYHAAINNDTKKRIDQKYDADISLNGIQIAAAAAATALGL
jgi:hypothetical protein